MRASVLLLLAAGCASSTRPATEAACDAETFARPDESPEGAARRYLSSCGLEETVELTKALVRFPTVRAEQNAADGPAFTGMAAFLKSWAEAGGLGFESFGENDAWEIQAGKGEPFVSFVMHADVVPADPEQWKTPPFETRRMGDRLYGRGTEDDKGPIAAVLVMIRALNRFGVSLPGRVTAVMGTGEEHDWDGMVAYAKERPHARYVISLDANYPVVVAESGFVAWRLTAPMNGKKKSPGCAEVEDVEVGKFLTQVPGEAHLTLSGRSKETIEAVIAERREQLTPYTFEVDDDEAGRVRVIVRGEAVHSSEADQGHNAFWGLAQLSKDLQLCEGGVATMMALVSEKLAGDHWGQKLGLAYEDPVMGRLLVAPTMLQTEKDRVVLSVNMRRPAGRSVEEFETALDRATQSLKEEFGSEVDQLIEKRYVGKPAVADIDGPLVSTLLQVYADATGEADPEPISIRGGTYARLFPGAVSFGPAMPGHTYRGHSPNEYVELDELQLMVQTTMEAVLKLRATAP